jgi:hypothetical protein
MSGALKFIAPPYFWATDLIGLPVTRVSFELRAGSAYASYRVHKD